jgi:proteasome lid subunit RPN8/RPN11
MMLARQRFPAGIACDLRAVDAISSAGRASIPSETGGILLGWETTSGFELTDALVIDDPSASTTSYTRNPEASQAALDHVLLAQPDGSPLGYIGEWHSHPAPCPPSSSDVRAMRRIGKQLSDRPCVLLVAAFHSEGNMDLHGLIATRWRCIPSPVHRRSPGQR